MTDELEKDRRIWEVSTNPRSKSFSLESFYYNTPASNHYGGASPLNIILKSIA
jgi:hypothetical protein